MEYFVISAKFVPLKYYALSSQLHRLASFSVGCSGRRILSPRSVQYNAKMVYWFKKWIVSHWWNKSHHHLWPNTVNTHDIMWLSIVSLYFPSKGQEIFKQAQTYFTIVPKSFSIGPKLNAVGFEPHPFYFYPTLSIKAHFILVVGYIRVKKR